MSDASTDPQENRTTTETDTDEQPTTAELAERVEQLEDGMKLREPGSPLFAVNRRAGAALNLLKGDRFIEDDPEPVLDRLDRIEERQADLAERLQRLEAVADPSTRSYEEMSRSDKVRRLREHVVKLAQKDSRGTMGVDYNAVISLFDGNPAPGTAYNLMESAAEKDGFSYGGDPKRLGVDLDRLKDRDLLSGVEE